MRTPLLSPLLSPLPYQLFSDGQVRDDGRRRMGGSARGDSRRCHAVLRRRLLFDQSGAVGGRLGAQHLLLDADHAESGLDADGSLETGE